ncbi:putative alpha-ketoglutarate dependent xanthine dioxygenase protein [Phaeoacremonium minimum UCRPA7]|uniref:Putative alpha-ketoglutarate dependent xanthine dioxygenase protein n=1 Tax=Phaeoacremonium minimum (strain UCR-PA7) TaxID=1286976 RepID=R8BAR0_PHAM7|nr:putative alpha-ketoglutarate dependent xanthine dioxygenase protein [Phaeoacremonium minimum UCRPA7]EON96408.1 putative alpha-ketoglutarate dependent xanthine dioxygenase protein [Phaeoacremonium minimum UCRPA7]
MSPSTLLPEPSFTLTPMDKTPKEKHNFGAVITDLDLSDISDEDVKALSDAIWTHKVVVVKGQKDLAPIKQWELVTRFDPDAPQVHSHGDIKTFNKKGGMLSRYRDVHGIPGAENVRLIGKGYQGEDHFGLKDTTITHALSHDWHAIELPLEEFNKGHTRFQRWHIDAPLYARDPAWFTTLRCIKRPKAPECPNITIHWDDGSGTTMETEPGLTAFFSNVQMYELMSDEEKKIADHSWVEYAPHPYQWIGDCKGNTTGLGLYTQGKEKKIEEMGDWDPKDVKSYPMVWVNPVTGEKAFMVHGICARKLFIRSSPDEEPKVLDDVVEIRAFLNKIQSRVLKPEYIMIPALDEGDIVMWANYQMFHTAVDYPNSFGPRSMHQANIGASKGPIGPVPIPITA